MSYNLLSRDEVSQRLRIAPVTLDTYWRRGNGPIRTRIGGRIFVREEHLAQWVASCAESPTNAVQSGTAQ